MSIRRSLRQIPRSLRPAQTSARRSRRLNLPSPRPAPLTTRRLPRLIPRSLRPIRSLRQCFLRRWLPPVQSRRRRLIRLRSVRWIRFRRIPPSDSVRRSRSIPNSSRSLRSAVPAHAEQRSVPMRTPTDMDASYRQRHCRPIHDSVIRPLPARFSRARYQFRSPLLQRRQPPGAELADRARPE